MFAIEFFVGAARGRYVRGRHRWDTQAEAQEALLDDLKAEAGFGGVYFRRVVSV